MRDGDDHLVVGIEILGIEFAGGIVDLGATGIAVLLTHLYKFVFNHAAAYFGIVENKFQTGDKVFDLFVLLVEFILLQAGELSQTHIHDRLSLDVGEAETLAESRLGRLRTFGITYYLDNLVDMVGGDDKSFENMRAILSFLQLELCAANHHFVTVIHECLYKLLEIEQLRTTVYKRHIVNRERRLHRSHLVELVEHNIGVGILTQLDNYSHPLACIGLVIEVGYTVEFLIVYELGDILYKFRLIDTVGNLAHDNHLMLLFLLDLCLGTHYDTASAGGIRLFHSGITVDGASGGKIGSRQIMHQAVCIYFRIIDVCEAGVYRLRKVVGRHIRGHTHGDTLRAVYKEVRYTGGENHRLLAGIVVSRLEIHRIGIYIAKHLLPYLLKADLGITHSRRAVAVDRAEIAMPVDQTLTHSPGLRHSHDGAVNGRVAMRMIFTHYLSDCIGGLFMGFVGGVAHFIHSEQHAAVNGLHTVAHIREGTGYNHRHRIVDVGRFHLVFNIDLDNTIFFQHFSDDYSS